MNLKLIYKHYEWEPFILTAETVLTAETIMSDYHYQITNSETMAENKPTLRFMTPAEYMEKYIVFTVEFTTTDETEPVLNAQVTINGITKLTNHLGVTSFMLAPGTYQYTIVKAGYETIEDEVVVFNENVDIPVALLAVYDAEFTITDTEGAVADATITINTMEKTTNAEGKATFNLRPGTYQYTVTKTDYETAEDEIEIVATNIEVPVTLTASGADPIQDLVDEYKAYVTTQGGEHGVSDADMYAEYEDMVTKGEITNTGVNTKLVLNGGLWGYKMGAGTKIDYIYSLTKIGGNFFVWDTSGAIVTDLIGGKIQITTLPLFDLDYAFNSFYVELKSLFHTYGTSRSDVFRALNMTTNLRVADASTGRLRLMIPAPDAYSGNDFFAAVAADYKFNFNRSNVGGTEKLDLVCERDGSTEHTFAQRDWALNMNDDTFALSFHSSSDRVLNSFKFALQ